MSDYVEPRPYLQPPPDLELPLWRYLSFDKFKSLMTTSSIYFCRSDRFDDKLEGSYGIANNDAKYDRLYAPPSAPPELVASIRANMRGLITASRVESYISCWHINYSESARMWKEYCGDGKGKVSNDGVCIVTTYDKLSKEIKAFDNGISVGFVNYIDHATSFIPEFDMVAPYYCKSKRLFIHEQELRLLWTHPYREGSWKMGEGAPPGHLAKVNLENLIQFVIPSPKATDEHIKTIKKLCIDAGVDQDKIRDSEIKNF